MGIKKQLVIGAAALAYMQGAYSLELTLLGGAELEWTDNVYLSNENRRNDLLETIRAGVRAEDSDTWYELNLDYEASHERYERESFDAETYYSGAASVLLIPLPDRFDWLFSVESTTTQRDSVLADTPDNRDQRNIYRTAPRLVLLALSRDTVALNAEASRITFRDDEESESNRVGGSLTWDHQLSVLTSLNLTGGHQKVNFELAEDYERDSYSLGFTRQINNGTISLSAGQTRLTPEESEELEGANYMGSIEWGTDLHSFRFDAIHDLTDTSAGFASGVNTSPEFLSPTDINTGEVDIITRTRFSLSDTYLVTGATTLYGMIYNDDEESETDPADTTERTGGVLSVRRGLNPDVDLELAGRYEKSREGVDEIEDDTVNIRLSLYKRFGEQVTLAGWLEREEGDGEVDEQDYEVHRVGASLTAEF